MKFSPDSSFASFTSPVSSNGYQFATGGFNAQTGVSYTLQSSDNGKIITMSNVSGITLTVPTGLSVGFSCAVIQTNSGQVTFTGVSTTINSYGGYTKLAGIYAGATLLSYSNNVYNLGGQLA